MAAEFNSAPTSSLESAPYQRQAGQDPERECKHGPGRITATQPLGRDQAGGKRYGHTGQATDEGEGKHRSIGPGRAALMLNEWVTGAFHICAKVWPGTGLAHGRAGGAVPTSTVCATALAAVACPFSKASTLARAASTVGSAHVPPDDRTRTTIPRLVGFMR